METIEESVGAARPNIIAVEDDEVEDAADDDVIPGPSRRAPHANTLNRSNNNNRQWKPRFSVRTSRHQPSQQDELQISNTEHYWAGTGILADRHDLELDPEKLAEGCKLLQAAARGDIPAVQRLLQNTHVNFRDYDRRTAVHVAASEGHVAMVRYLVETCGAQVQRSDRWGGSPLDDAHRHGHTKVAQYLRQQGATTGSLNRSTQFIKAAATGDVEEIKFLIEALPELKDIGDYDQRTALHLASAEGNADIVELLLKAGANPNVEDRWGCRPLDGTTDLRTQKILMAAGAVAGKGNHVALDLDSSGKRANNNMEIEFDQLELIDQIGSGAFGEIYKCRWRGTLVAAKIIKSAKIQKIFKARQLQNTIRAGAVDDAIHAMDEEGDQEDLDSLVKEDALADFRREISVLKSLRHPHIVLLLAFSTTEDYECLISELMKCSLLDLFQSHNLHGTLLSHRHAIVFATQLALGMNYLHTCQPAVLHRDLKPANLLIDRSGVLKISDFGLSKLRPTPSKTEQQVYTMTGETGSYRFMAPEVFLHQEYNETVDVYSYAMIVFYLLTSRPPWPTLSGLDAVQQAAVHGDRPAIPRSIDIRLNILLRDCWDENASARPPFVSVLALLEAYSSAVWKNDDIMEPPTASNARCSCVLQ